MAGISSALNTSVTGLQGQSERLAGISDNIANSKTTGFKRNETRFESLVVSEEGMGVSANTYREATQSGSIQDTGVRTDFAVDGGGWMVVSEEPGSQENLLTKAGSFTPDDEGFLRNEQGYYLKGTNLRDLPTGAAEPALTKGNLGAVNVEGVNFRPQPTSNISFKGNLPDGAAVGETYTTQVEYVNELGGTETLTLNWNATATANQFDLTIGDSGGGTADGSTTTVEFNDGTGTPPQSPGSLSGFSSLGGGVADNGDGSLSLNVGSGAMPNIDLDLGTPADSANGVSGLDGVTMEDGGYVVTGVNADGDAFSTFERVEMGEGGLLEAVFQNGARQAISRVPVGDVVNANDMDALDGQAFRANAESGPVEIFQSGQGVGNIAGGALENSNVELSEELTNMIETQRTYSANATGIRTSDQMLQELVRLKS